MTLITIRQHTPAAPNGANATIQFDTGPIYPLTINDPFDQQAEQHLEWYFEKHLEYPFTDHIKAHNCAKSVSTYGETILKHVFADHDVYSDYRDCLKNGLTTVQISIEGSPTFHRLHWETLKDPKHEHPPRP